MRAEYTIWRVASTARWHIQKRRDDDSYGWTGKAWFKGLAGAEFDTALEASRGLSAILRSEARNRADDEARAGGIRPAI